MLVKIRQDMNIYCLQFSLFSKNCIALTPESSGPSICDVLRCLQKSVLVQNNATLIPACFLDSTMPSVLANCLHWISHCRVLIAIQFLSKCLASLQPGLWKEALQVSPFVLVVNVLCKFYVFYRALEYLICFRLYRAVFAQYQNN